MRNPNGYGCIKIPLLKLYMNTRNQQLMYLPKRWFYPHLRLFRIPSD